MFIRKLGLEDVKEMKSRSKENVFSSLISEKYKSFWICCTYRFLLHKISKISTFHTGSWTNNKTFGGFSLFETTTSSKMHSITRLSVSDWTYCSCCVWRRHTSLCVCVFLRVCVCWRPVDSCWWSLLWNHCIGIIRSNVGKKWHLDCFQLFSACEAVCLLNGPTCWPATINTEQEGASEQSRASMKRRGI